MVSWVKIGSPKDVIDIYFQGNDNQRIQTDKPEFVTIMGEKVQTYGSGNEEVAFATQPIKLTAPDGTASYYTFEFNNANLYTSRAIPAFGW